MNGKPILFSGEMVRAILEGRKTQTRRVINPQIEWDEDIFQRRKNGTIDQFTYSEFIARCPYGQPGDRLWVREKWQQVYERGDGQRFTEPFVGAQKNWIEYAATPRDEHEPPRWRPSIHMPLKYSRIALEIVNVSVTRVQDISRHDAKAEGVSNLWINPPANKQHYQRVLLNPYIANYSVLWDKINEPRGFGWDMNPWVWVIEFKRV
jgi:hypothetical protein